MDPALPEPATTHGGDPRAPGTADAGPAMMSFGQLWRDPPVGMALAAQFAVSTGVMLQAAALGKQVYDITGRELDLGWLGLAEFLPSALLVLVTGSVVDRLNRRVVAMCALGGELLCTLFFLFYARSEPSRVWPLFVMAVAFGVARAFLSPAMRVMSPMVAPDGSFTRVIALNSAMWTSAIIIGPAASGFLYSAAPWLAYLVAAVLTAIGIGLVGLIKFRRRPEPPKERATLHSALEGLRLIRRTPILLAAVSLDLFAVLFGGAVALLPAIAEDRLGVGDVAYGWLRAAQGVGAALMAIGLAVRPFNRRIGPTLFIVVAIFGLGTVALGLTRTYWVAFVAIVGLSAADMISVYIRSTLVPLATPPGMQGRVTAVEHVFIGASNELGAFESGVAAALIGTAAAVTLGGVATLAVVGIWWFAFPVLRRIDSFPEQAT